MARMYQTVTSSLKTLFYYTIKLDVLLVYIFSLTPFFLPWIILLIIGFFSGKNSDLFSAYCIIFLTYIYGTATLLCIVWGTKISKNWVEILIGLSFREKFAPRKGLSNFSILLVSTFLVAFLLILEIRSLHYSSSLMWQDYEGESLCLFVSLSLCLFVSLSLLRWDYYNQGKYCEADQTHKISLLILESISKIKEIISVLAAHPYFIWVHHFLSKILCL